MWVTKAFKSLNVVFDRQCSSQFMKASVLSRYQERGVADYCIRGVKGFEILF